MRSRLDRGFRRESVSRAYGHTLLSYINSIERDATIWLDAGCGENSGIHNTAISHYGGMHIGLDVDEEKLIRYADGAMKILSDMERMPLTDNCVDLITLRWVVEHLRNPSKALEELSRVLKPNACMILITPNACSYKTFIVSHFPTLYLRIRKRQGVAEPGRYPHFYRANTRHELCRILRDKGLAEEALHFLPKLTLYTKGLILYGCEYLLVWLMDKMCPRMNADILAVFRKK